ncbi:hypothetical protein TrLO_g7392 [Triparma laevis f. longispina]|uniref:Uncharacterized protein n=1 Tax=Triparma laevis f. longispina TaxID=1714387 RepID=A0A9W6ZXW9_9STRA|nr:hypothetical protein TrLO_g7392 [Triparma laevis f. longispina]
METYEGTHHEVSGAENTGEDTNSGFHIVKDLTENTCEWTRAQQVDVNIAALPAAMMEFAATQHLAWANTLQEEFRRNGKEMGRERVAAVAGEIIERRGKRLIEDQVAVFASCEEVRNCEERSDELGIRQLRSKLRLHEELSDE